MNKRTVPLTEEQYIESIKLLREGFILDGSVVRPNHRIATIEVLQAVLGLRIGDTLKLRMTSFIKDGDRWRLDIVEEKTGKVRDFTVPMEVYLFIQQYAYENGIGKEAKLFDVSERQVERHINKVFLKMGLNLRYYGTHSYRKFFSMSVYKDSGFDIVAVQKLLQHSSPHITQRYLGVSQAKIEELLLSRAKNIA